MLRGGDGVEYEYRRAWRGFLKSTPRASGCRDPILAEPWLLDPDPGLRDFHCQGLRA